MSGDLGAAPPSLDDVAEAVVRASTTRTSTTFGLNDSCADCLRAVARRGGCTGVHRGRRSTASHP